MERKWENMKRREKEFRERNKKRIDSKKDRKKGRNILIRRERMTRDIEEGHRNSLRKCVKE